jgi:uncharacterized repeat protein (TIGR03803 family)
VFEVKTNGNLTALVSFMSANGANPEASLTLGRDDNFYGSTYAGGSSNVGTVFRVTTNGTLTSLLSFSSANGANPQAGLTLGQDGNFYGTARLGGSSGNGTVFRVTTNGILATLINFTSANGAVPIAGLTLGLDGLFYGATSTGGSGGGGEVYRLILPTLPSFDASPTNGQAPMSVQFNSANVDSTGNAITQWNWTFGDGGTSTAENPTHTYSALGHFTPTLTATNGLGVFIAVVGPSINVGTSSAPTLAASALSITNLLITGANGIAGATNYILMSTNLALPRSQWISVATNVWSGSGTFILTLTNSLNRGVPNRFYLLAKP